MTGLALRSLRHRATAFTATFVAVFLGTALIGSFATLVEASTGPVSATDSETLVTMGAVVGGWGALIVLFSIASTVGITVRQREVEIGLLRTIGTTPRQTRRLVRTETLVVTTLAALGGALVASVTGRMLLAALRSGGLVSDDVAYDGGGAALAATVAGVVLVSLLASGIAGRRATRGSVAGVLAEGAADKGRLRWWRVLAAVLFIGYGLVMSVVTITVSAHSDDPYDAMATSGSCGILVGVGFALLAPALLRWLSVAAAPFLGRAGVAGHLAAYNTSRRAHLLAGVLAPVMVLTAGSIGTLMMVGTDGRTLDPTGELASESDTINLLNNVVTAMISLFAVIVVVNSFAAVVSHRRAELNRLWLLGATPEQVRNSVTAEAAVVAGVGVVLGFVASLATIIPFGVARHEGVVPDGQLWLPPLLVVGVVVLTLASARSAVRRVAPATSAGRPALR